MATDCKNTVETPRQGVSTVEISTKNKNGAGFASPVGVIDMG
jgi:hypothetical protein